METKRFQMLTKKRICALITLLIMIINMFSPYRLLINTVHAAEQMPSPGEPYWKLKLLPVIEGTDEWDYYYYDIDEEDPADYTGPKYIFMEL